MRLIFGIMSLLVVLVVVGSLVKKQLGAVYASQNAAIPSQSASAFAATERSMQSQQIEEQIKQSDQAFTQRSKIIDAE